MEDYDKFVKSRLSQLKTTEDVDKNQPKCASSVICFYGRPILPPLLSGPQREEMGRHRDAAQKAAENRKSNDPRLAYVQTILHSVHLRKTPTLEELLQESEVYTKASSNGSVSDCSLSKNSPSPSFRTNDRDSSSIPSFTTCSALASHMSPQISYSEGRHINQQASYQRSHLSLPIEYSHQSLTSGYVSCLNAENNIYDTGIDTECQKESLFDSDKRGDCTEGFFIYNTSNTVIKMPDILNYPPVDGEELERSGQESSFSDDLKAGNSESISFVDPFSAEESCSVLKDCKENTSFANQMDKDQEFDIKCDLTDTPKELQTSQCLTEIHVQPSETIQVDEQYLKPSEEPYRMSLQTLLKKSQEYRRRQRMVRSQAKNAKILDSAQDQPKSEEHSLSDKENDERHTKGTASELRTSQEKSDTGPQVDQSLKKSYESDRKSLGGNMQSQVTIESKAHDNIIAFESAIDQSTKINNWVNAKGPKDYSQSMPVWAENLNKSAYTSPSEIKKYHTIPAPNFCRSPIHCKVKSPSAEPPLDKISQRQALINKSMNKDHKVEEGNSRTADTSPLSAVVESDVTSVLAKSSLHIDQLEFNLSGLKVLISDLENTLTENVDKSSSQSESQQTQLSQNDFSICWSVDNCNALNGDLNKSLSPDSINENTLDTGAIRLRDKRLTKTVTTREKEHIVTNHKNVQNMRRQPSAKCVLSTAQRMRIPDVFRTSLPEDTVQHSVSVLSDTSNYTVTQKNYSDLDYSSRSPFLNQSYDVDTPSELWLHEASCCQRSGAKKHLTPESVSEGQGGGSKVKRRLHMTEDLHEQGDTVERQRKSESRPNSNTSRAAAWRHEGLGNVKERQEQLRQVHAAQIKALQEEHQRQQEELIQALAARYRVLQSMSVPCSLSTSRLGDTVTFPTLSYPPYSPLPEQYRHLLVAALKGFLTRRLLKTERIGQLVRTVRDTQQFLQAFQQHSPNKELCSRQDLLLQERVTLQLRSARYEVYDIFFSLSNAERMQLISLDRDLARERQLKRLGGNSAHPKEKSSLSAATQKSLERKRTLMMQKKTAERHRGAGMSTRHKPGFSAEQPLENQQGQFRANPQRVPKSTYTSRPR